MHAPSCNLSVCHGLNRGLCGIGKVATAKHRRVACSHRHLETKHKNSICISFRPATVSYPAHLSMQRIIGIGPYGSAFPSRSAVYYFGALSMKELPYQPLVPTCSSQFRPPLLLWPRPMPSATQMRKWRSRTASLELPPRQLSICLSPRPISVPDILTNSFCWNTKLFLHMSSKYKG